MCVPELIPHLEQDSSFSCGWWLCFVLTSQGNPWENISWDYGRFGSRCRVPWLWGGAEQTVGCPIGKGDCTYTESDGDSHLGDLVTR